MNLTGTTIAITGAARGIGYACAKALIDQGARVVMSDIDEEALSKAAAELSCSSWQRLDVTDAQAFESFLASIEKNVGPLDALINNAGIMPAGPLLDEDDVLTRRTLEIDTLGVMYGTKKALALMVPRGRGHIINVASTLGETSVPGLATYNAAKAAALRFTDTVRVEYRTSGVRLSAVLPGPVQTELISGMDNSISVTVPFTKRELTLVPIIEPEDIAAAVVQTLRGGRSRARVYVPKVFGPVMTTQRLLPRRASEAFVRAAGGDKQGLDVDEGRASYRSRISGS